MTIFTKLYFLTLFLTFSAGFFYFNRHTRAFKLLIILISISFVTEASADFVGMRRHNNMPLFHLYAIVEFVFLTLIYLHSITGGLNKAIKIIAVPAILFMIVNSSYLQSIDAFPSNSVLLCETIYVFYSFLGFRQIILHPASEALYKQSFFWLNIALLFFSTTLFIQFGLINYENQHNLPMDTLGLLVNIVNFIYAVLLGLSVLINRRRTLKS